MLVIHLVASVHLWGFLVQHVETASRMNTSAIIYGIVGDRSQINALTFVLHYGHVTLAPNHRCHVDIYSHACNTSLIARKCRMPSTTPLNKHPCVLDVAGMTAWIMV